MGKGERGRETGKVDLYSASRQ